LGCVTPPHPLWQPLNAFPDNNNKCPFRQEQSLQDIFAYIQTSNGFMSQDKNGYFLCKIKQKNGTQIE